MPVDDDRRSGALDGIRAVAVSAVIAFHLGVGAVAGGLLGVDLFFVLSGFLITGLLLSEWRRTGRISLRRFWTRRWRRLLPALLLTLVAVAVLEYWLADPAEVRSVRRDILATLFYGANWNSVVAGHSYFAAFAAPSPLRHTWSLAVEEQFYVVWPLIAILALTVRRSRGLLMTIAVIGAALSASLMCVLSLSGVGIDRLYYGTDTRAQALLVGAALAISMDALGRDYAGRPREGGALRPLTRRTNFYLAAAAWTGAAALVLFLLRLKGESAVLYRGGFALVAIATAAVVAQVVLAPRSVLARLLSLPPLPYIGRISYGLYLWHWPAVVFLTPVRTGLHGFGLGALRLAVTFAVSAISFRLIEQPIRLQRLRIPWARVSVPVAVAAAALALLAAPLPHSSGTLAALDMNHPPPPPPKAPALPRSSQTTSPGPQRASQARILAPAINHPGPMRVMLIGDSVAYSLGLGLAPAVDPSQVTFTNQGYVGCGIARGGATSFASYTQPADCLTWPQRWSSLVDTFRPDVTLVLLGRWEVLDRQHDGEWMHIGQPKFDAYLRSELDLAVRTLTAQGGRVAFLDPPCNDRSRAEAVSPGRLPSDDAQRVQRFIELTKNVIAQHPGVSERIAFADVVCPGGQYEHTRNGQQLRTSDGVHLEPLVGQIFNRDVLPTVIQWLRTPVTRPA